MKVMSELASRAWDMSFPSSAVAAAERLSELMRRRHITVGDARIVDYCVFAARLYDRSANRFARNLFSEATMRKFAEAGAASRIWEDRWLEGHGISRIGLIALIAPHEETYPEHLLGSGFDEGTRRRRLNKDGGFLICQTGTIGWSPRSESCGMCIHSQRCREISVKRYPSLHAHGQR